MLRVDPQLEQKAARGTGRGWCTRDIRGGHAQAPWGSFQAGQAVAPECQASRQAFRPHQAPQGVRALLTRV